MNEVNGRREPSLVFHCSLLPIHFVPHEEKLVIASPIFLVTGLRRCSAFEPKQPLCHQCGISISDVASAQGHDVCAAGHKASNVLGPVLDVGSQAASECSP